MEIDNSIPENKLSYIIRGAAFTVYNNLGPGLLESVYVAALAYELNLLGNKVRTEVGVPLIYGDIKLDQGYRLDILVDDLVIIEVKSVELVNDVHRKQLLTYLKLSGKRLGLLINFNSADLSKSIERIVLNLY